MEHKIIPCRFCRFATITAYWTAIRRLLQFLARTVWRTSRFIQWFHVENSKQLWDKLQMLWHNHRKKEASAAIIGVEHQKQKKQKNGQYHVIPVLLIEK